jgi:hypothetical protein
MPRSRTSERPTESGRVVVPGATALLRCDSKREGATLAARVLLNRRTGYHGRTAPGT